MFIKLHNYNGAHRIVSLAKSRETYEEMISEEYNIVLLEADRLVFYPQNDIYMLDTEEYDFFNGISEYSIIEFSKDAYVVFDCGSYENALFITNRCNSSCIMCPTSSKERRLSEITDIDTLLTICRQIPTDTNNLIITGGEPFLLGKDIFILFDYLKNNLASVNYLLLTNGRIFSNLEYFTKFCETMPDRIEVAIPIHGHNAELHDFITQANKSFRQTVTGIKRLLKAKVKVQIRVVVSRLNVNNLNDISRLIADELKGVEKVTFIGLEMLGDAYRNRDTVWIDYKESMKSMSSAIDILVINGIDTEIYNYPLCCIDKRFWTICQKSISPHKVRFSDECEKCGVKEFCSGMFLGTNAFLKDTIKAVK